MMMKPRWLISPLINIWFHWFTSSCCSQHVYHNFLLRVFPTDSRRVRQRWVPSWFQTNGWLCTSSMLPCTVCGAFCVCLSFTGWVACFVVVPSWQYLGVKMSWILNCNTIETLLRCSLDAVVAVYRRIPLTKVVGSLRSCKARHCCSCWT